MDAVSLNHENLNRFVGQMLNDLGGAFSVSLVRIGNALGLYKALRDYGPMSSSELARKTGLAERYLREWLSHQAASNYLTYNPVTRKFALPPEQALVFADEESELYLVDAFDAAVGYIENQPKVEAAFKTGGGVQWTNQAGCLSCAIARFFRPGYQANIVDKWLPALDGVVDKLKRGAKVADVGCGHGYSTAIMAAAFPKSQFFGFDFDPNSIAAARKHAEEHAGPKGKLANLTFEVAPAKEFPGTNYDLVTFFDCLHDMGDPAGAAAHVRKSIKPDGTWMIVEPFAHDELENNLNPVGRLYYAASTMTCVPTSLSQEVGAALGAQAGESRLREVVRQGGFGSLRRAAETPFNLILEASV
ncbi:MAG: class I SAM-dependent methyltransferase [Kiloniellales bacterium]